MREVWWDIRPHPDFGTVELRMCDGIPSMSEICAIAALAQSLVAHLDQLDDRGYTLPRHREWVLRQNKWRAGRHGLDTDLIIDAQGSLEPLRTAMVELLEELGPTARKLGCTERAGEGRTHPRRGPSYERQRRAAPDVIDQPSDLKPVVDLLIARARHRRGRSMTGDERSPHDAVGA